MYILLFSETHSTLMTNVTIIVHQKIPPENLKSYDFYFFFTIKQFLKEPVDMLQTNQYSCICNSLSTCNKGIIINHAMNRYAFFFSPHTTFSLLGRSGEK